MAAVWLASERVAGIRECGWHSCIYRLAFSSVPGMHSRVWHAFESVEWLAFECSFECIWHSSVHVAGIRVWLGVARSIEARHGWCGIADHHHGRGCDVGVSDGDWRLHHIWRTPVAVWICNTAVCTQKCRRSNEPADCSVDSDPTITVAGVKLVELTLFGNVLRCFLIIAFYGN